MVFYYDYFYEGKKKKTEKTSRHLLKLSRDCLEEIVFRLSDMMVWEGEKNDCEGFEPTVLTEVKFPEMSTGSLVRSERPQYCIQVS